MPEEFVDVWLSVQELADLLYVTPITITRWAREGKISSYRSPSGKIKFLWSEVQQWVPHIANPPQPPPPQWKWPTTREEIILMAIAHERVSASTNEGIVHYDAYRVEKPNHKYPNLPGESKVYYVRN